MAEQWYYISRPQLLQLCRDGRAAVQHPDGSQAVVAVQVYGDADEPAYRPPREGQPYIRTCSNAKCSRRVVPALTGA